ncbi:hypothetical protein J008_03283 [Cryptococcus neoformans]|uniref:Isochorismatase-like domain-containing protein n=2 Tax=Cryptococcus neoformans TaxID=5207 RepID=A0A854QJX4_CRYNE|nr:hypothetical protein CNAG_02427 [Cryptococcus neoformans var. grubii H99]AUB25208.1 hypothetical protein CKF44_02427 [Cryptococcus neoformans var. grubii]OWT39304.1 hypothetical protein C362_02897 [Cryptococcus neoformans var. grubii Bt1]OWZ31477.1 hypothetical protein C347_03568 [Cryptococcus neoformans var. grubii AD2-60a]OWZ42607.1 hypothetical protein C353_03411 [Cryptococcus neoformans var. grubii AD1-83a]OWZ43638.1 hypothetical protein C343_03505 [Cryptococcus neoformans var. grubii C|eukprot:XP_012049724.1 hypothetical protein CNAG_02427 [Cryptococcus neoformans var. grubii H99]
MSAAPHTLLLVCDLQERKRQDIWEFDAMSSMISKMVRAAKILEIATLTTEQNSKDDPKALGTIEEVGQHLQQLEHNNLGIYKKNRLSMQTKGTRRGVDFQKYDTFIVTGIEAHVCILQTALDLLRLESKPTVFIPADCISSGNKQEIPIALRRMERDGAVITTSESVLFELLGDADHPKFEALVDLIKGEAENTRKALAALL